MGALPERAPVGHRARGLQRERQRLGLLHPRPGAFPRLSLGRGRLGRAFPTTNNASALPSRSGTGRIPSSRSALFGLTNSEGNHGEDVKEYYFYLDSTPTHSYMKYLYKYPQAAYPYDQLVLTNRGRSRQEFEYELLNTGVFDEDRYFDVFVEYAKESPEDILVQISVHNRGPEPAEIHVLPTLWFRNRWSWGRDNPRPSLQAVAGKAAVVRASRSRAGRALSLLRRPGVPAVHGKRNQREAAVQRTEPDSLRQGRHQQFHRPRPNGCRESGEDRDQGRGALSPDRAGRESARSSDCG